ncbi:hypothetical protein RHODO2019_13090 [Rhodococcus antarcticus]|uniref:Uncharacterized protein n=1 Tax=Rhodococcus antarcticus TaxID=2987751 RepID=A0ABY6NXY9_9NOCA|nr:hypothetical protein [Rhodococcus antarcticus]UZJ24094.1 hypothetical protein RHODO2019_13090 [Rhodococcus antarcticus]
MAAPDRDGRRVHGDGVERAGADDGRGTRLAQVDGTGRPDQDHVRTGARHRAQPAWCVRPTRRRARTGPAGDQALAQRQHEVLPRLGRVGGPARHVDLGDELTADVEGVRHRADGAAHAQHEGDGESDHRQHGQHDPGDEHADRPSARGRWGG